MDDSLTMSLIPGHKEESKSMFLDSSDEDQPFFKSQIDSRELKEILNPHPYQEKAVESILREKKYGSIVFMDTGSGKTYIAIMILKHIFEQDV